MSVEVTLVQSRADRRRFLSVPWTVYRGDPLWVPPLIPERMNVIHPARGSFFQRGAADFYIAWKDGKPVGTICAAEDPAANAIQNTKNCMFGFFEYIHDYDVFCALLENAARWAESRGLDTFFGPFNLDYEDGYGVLVEGRDRPPALLCGHTPPYYQDFMERHGFVPARPANVAFAIDELDSELMQRLSRIAERLKKKARIRVRQVDFDDLDAEIDRVHQLLLESLPWSEAGIPWRRESVQAIAESFQSMADPELILFAEADGQTVGWFPGVPNWNEVLIRVNGLRYPWNYLELYFLTRKQPLSLSIKSVLVLPEYQKRGAAVLMFEEMIKRAVAKGYRWADLSITSVDNPDTVELAELFGAVEYKRWQVYRKSINHP